MKPNPVVPVAVALALLCWAVALPTIARAGSPPPWLQAQVNAPLPQHDDKTDAILLYSEIQLTVLPDGQRKYLERYAYRILRNDGERFGVVHEGFDSQSRITDLHAWSIPSQGKPYEVGMRDSAETALFGVDDSELISDERTKLLRIPASVPGSVVGYEVERTENRPSALTAQWLFDRTIPVQEAHFTIQLPPGWSLKPTWINHPEETASTPRPNQSEWVLRDLKAIKVEERMPPWRGIAGRLSLALIPPNGQQQGFQNWQEMGTWYEGLVRGRTDSTPAIKQTVTQLTQSAPSQLEKMRALAAWVQKDIRYVGIELGIGGFQPHTATDVFTHRYGDCKDKTTLLASMFKEIGVDSYYFVINTVRGSISDGTPANQGFNHMIMAIRLPAGVEDPTLLAVLTHPRLGKLLFFDPTNPQTPLGGLRGDLQANYGLLVTPEGGELLRTPQLPVGVNAIARTAKMTLDTNGTLHGDISEVWSGDQASFQRAMAQAAAVDTDVIKPVERVVSQSLSTYDILKASMTNARANDKPFQWRYTINAPNYAKTAGDLLLVRPRILGSNSTSLLETQEPRRYPIEFEGTERDTDVFEIALPEGYEVDELPPPVSVDYGFVSYQSKTESVGRTLKYSRTFERKELSVPVSKAEELKKFYRIVNDDERNSAVLKPMAAPSPLKPVAAPPPVKPVTAPPSLKPTKPAAPPR